MLERTDAITNEVLEPITFVLAHPTVRINVTLTRVRNTTVAVEKQRVLHIVQSVCL
jgi:hypothetical protein